VEDDSQTVSEIFSMLSTMAMTMAFPKLFVGDLKAFSFGCDPCCCVPNRESTQLNPRLTIAGQFAAHRDVGCENLIETGVHRLCPCLA